jgi:transcriptional regulator with XRE-family HTH domain
MLALGQAIRALRVREGLSQKELARRAQITPSFLSQVEGNHRSASLTVLDRISEALGVASEVLIWEAVELPKGMNEKDRRMCEIAKVIVRRMYENAGSATDDNG